MRDTRIRVLLHPKLEAHEQKAAIEAAERFSRFGLRVESISGPDPKLWMDLCRKRLYELAYKEGSSVLYGDEPLGRPHYFARVPHDGAILAGLTPHQIFHSADGRMSEMEGFNMFYVGAVVSAHGFRPGPGAPYRKSGATSAEEGAEAVSLCLTHELGHSLLGIKEVNISLMRDAPKRYDERGNCLTAGCIMQNVTDYVAFLRSSGAAKIDFCAGCADLLRGRVSEVTYYGAGGA